MIDQSNTHREGHGVRLIKNSALTIFNTLFMLLTGWIISIWVARQLGPAQYGIFNMVLWVSGTVSWFLGMGLINSVTRFIAEAKGRSESIQTAIILYVLKIEIFLTLSVTILLLFLRTAIADYFFSPSESFYFFLAFLGLLPGILTAVFSAAIEGIQKFEYFTLSSLCITPFSFAAKIFVLVLNKNIEGILLVMLFFSFINVLFYLLALRREGFFTAGAATLLPGNVKNRLKKYNLKVSFILLCDKIIWDKSENFFLGRFCQAAQLGYYNLAFNFVQRSMSLLPTTFWRVLFPAMSTYAGSGDQGKMKRLFYVATRYLAFVSFPVGIGGCILSHDLVRYLYGVEYNNAVIVLQILFITSMISSITQPASAVLYGYEKQSFILWYGISLALINISMNIYFIKQFGAAGAAICYATVTLLGTLGGFVYICFMMKLAYPLLSLFKTAIAAITMGGVIFIVNSSLPGIVGVSISIFAGVTCYGLCCWLLATIQKEDLTLLKTVKSLLPEPLRKFHELLIMAIIKSKRLTEDENV